MVRFWRGDWLVRYTLIPERPDGIYLSEDRNVSLKSTSTIAVQIRFHKHVPGCRGAELRRSKVDRSVKL